MKALRYTRETAEPAEPTPVRLGSDPSLRVLSSPILGGFYSHRRDAACYTRRKGYHNIRPQAYASYAFGRKIPACVHCLRRWRGVNLWGNPWPELFSCSWSLLLQPARLGLGGGALLCGRVVWLSARCALPVCFKHQNQKAGTPGTISRSFSQVRFWMVVVLFDRP